MSKKDKIAINSSFSTKTGPKDLVMKSSWKRWVKGKLKAMGLSMLLRKKSNTFNDIEWKDL